MITTGNDPQGDTNISAWDRLYSRTDALVWGNEPAPFVVTLLDRLRVDLNADSRILDAGTGEGRHLPLLLATGAHVSACDASAHALRKLPTALKQRVPTVQCDLAATPFTDGCFDLILLNDVFETLTDPRFVLKQMHRLLSPGGKLISNIPDHDDGVADHDMTPQPDGGYLYQGQYYYRFWSSDAAVTVFHECSLDVISNTTHTWQEGSHPEFRNEEHDHTSRILVARREPDTR